MNKLLIFFLFLSASSVAQKIPDYGFNKVRISGSDKNIQAELAPANTDPDIETDRIYYWYGSNVIHTTQGGFSGRLLDGKYSEYYLNKNLKQEGEFANGLKNGIWKDWDENGFIMQLFTWKKGVKAGKFMLYDTQGNLKQTGAYYNNTLDGEVKTFEQGKQPTVVLYKKGVVINKKPSFFKRIKVFKKKPGDSKAQAVQN